MVRDLRCRTSDDWPKQESMRTLALAFAFVPLLLAAPTSVAAEGTCPPSWDIMPVGPGFPADLNDNGMVCIKVRHKGPNNDVVYIRDDH
jgi:hypothetical protein